jgi:hypothetical protein
MIGRRLLDEHYAPEGYNIGVNRGSAAKQRLLLTHSPSHQSDEEHLPIKPLGGVLGVECRISDAIERVGEFDLAPKLGKHLRKNGLIVVVA